MSIGRQIASLAAILLFTGIVNGQVISGIGFKGGLASATFTNNSEYPSWQPLFWRYGFVFGLFADAFSSHRFSLQVEADVEEKGSNEKNHSDDPNSYITLYMLSIPLTARAFLLRGPIEPYVGAGPRVDILLAKVDGNIPQIFSSTRSATFGGTLVAGVQFKLSRNIFAVLEASYSPDFTNFMDRVDYSPAGIYGGELVTRNYAWEFKTGILFDVVKK